MNKNNLNNIDTKMTTKNNQHKGIKGQPILSPEIIQYFIPTSFLKTKNPNELFYKPMIIGAVSLNFANSPLLIKSFLIASTAISSSLFANFSSKANL